MVQSASGPMWAERCSRHVGHFKRWASTTEVCPGLILPWIYISRSLPFVWPLSCKLGMVFSSESQQLAIHSNNPWLSISNQHNGHIGHLIREVIGILDTLQNSEE